MLHRIAIASIISTIWVSASFAEETDPKFSIQLNLSKEVNESTCQVVFRGENHLGADIDDITLRLAMFGTDGGFMNMLALPLGRMIDGKTRAVQFNLRSSCSSISEIIVNDASACQLSGGAENSTDCIDKLEVSTLSSIAFGI